jgi:hypothetical protein
MTEQQVTHISILAMKRLTSAVGLVGTTDALADRHACSFEKSAPETMVTSYTTSGGLNFNLETDVTRHVDCHSCLVMMDSLQDNPK